MSKHFVTGEFESHASYVPDDIYGQILDNVVITCVDIICHHKGKILIGKRTIEPQPDWWIIGGRMKPGESFEDAAIRNLKRELSLKIDDQARFKFVGTYSLVWGKRAQKPVDHGCHTVSITLVIELTEDEIDTIQPNKEYDCLRWIYPSSLNDNFHPCLREMAWDLI